MKSDQVRSFIPLAVKLLTVLSLLVAIFFILSGYGYQWGIWSLGAAFSILTNTAYASIGLIVLNLAALLFVFKSGYRKGYPLLLAALLLMIVVLGTARYWQVQAESYPPIHDITTDIENPPSFDQVVALRTDAPNPPEYEGGETAEIQQEAYADLAPLFLDHTIETVFEAAVRLVEQRGWELVQANVESGIIEATEKLPWFGFKDDVVIRLDAIDSQTRVDMRSKSRIGVGDLGVNANRIQNYLNDLEGNFSDWNR